MRANAVESPIGTIVNVTLSRRNLESLIKMLDDGRLTGCLTARDNDIEMIVACEENETHYADRPAGRMSWEPVDG